VLEYSRSGHNPPLLKRGNSGRVRLLDGASTFPLGIFGDYEPPSERVQLDPKDTIVLYTDGITEAFGPGGVSDMFGLDGLRASLNECSGAPECVVDSVHAALYRHTGSRDRDDDQTIVAFQLVGAAEKDES
jgi:sigma-B regulation protein RsbU (phosphoserine phosphatase)